MNCAGCHTLILIKLSKISGAFTRIPIFQCVILIHAQQYIINQAASRISAWTLQLRSYYSALYWYSIENFNLEQIEVFYMKIIMRRVSEIFYPENLRNDNAVRRCLSDKTNWFYQIVLNGSIPFYETAVKRSAASPQKNEVHTFLAATGDLR